MLSTWRSTAILWLQDRKNQITLFLVFAFVVLRFYDYLFSPMVPDEVWHTGYMRDISAEFWEATNYMAYGGLFWGAGAFLSNLFQEPTSIYLMRFLALCGMAGGLFFLSRSARHQPQSIFVLILLFILSTPFMWWSHRYIMPEMYSWALIGLAAYWIESESPRLQAAAWIVLGVVLGLKISSLTVAFFFACHYAFFGKQKIWKAALFGFVGFVICNWKILSYPLTVIAQFRENVSSPPRLSFEEALMDYYLVLKNHIWNYIPAWDLVFFGGIQQMVISIGSLVLVAGILLEFYPKFRKSLLLTGFLILILMYLNRRWLNYYLFQPLYILPFCLARLAWRPERLKRDQILLSLAIFLNLSQTIPNIVRDQGFSVSNREQYERKHEIRTCIDDFIKDFPHPNVLFDFTDAGSDFNRGRLVEWNELTHPIDQKKLATFHGGNYASVYVADIVRSLEKYKSGPEFGVLIVTGQREMQLPFYQNFASDFVASMKLNMQRLSLINVELVREKKCELVEAQWVSLKLAN